VTKTTNLHSKAQYKAVTQVKAECPEAPLQVRVFTRTQADSIIRVCGTVSRVLAIEEQLPYYSTHMSFMLIATLDTIGQWTQRRT